MRKFSRRRVSEIEPTGDKVPYPEGPIWKNYASVLSHRMHHLRDKALSSETPVIGGEKISSPAKPLELSQAKPTIEAPTTPIGGGEAKG